MGDLRGAIRDLEYYLELPIGATRNRQVMKNIAYWHQLSMQVEPKSLKTVADTSHEIYFCWE